MPNIKTESRKYEIGVFVFIIAVLIAAFFLGHNKTQTTLPVTILPTSDGIEGSGMYADRYPQNISVTAPKKIYDQLAAYGTAYQVRLAPKLWTGDGGSGVDGGSSIYLYPLGGSMKFGPHIFYRGIPACIGCMVDAAAPFFSSATSSYNESVNQGYSNEITIPTGLQVTPISKTLITYTLPNKNGLLTHGVVYYNPGNDTIDPYFTSAEFVLPENQTSLADFLSKAFIEDKKLQ